MKIYILYHNQLENTNIFFTSKNEAENYIDIISKETNTLQSEWNIDSKKKNNNLVRI